MREKKKLLPGEPRSFSEFVDYAQRKIHNELLRSGADGIRTAMYEILPYFLKWREYPEIKEGRTT